MPLYVYHISLCATSRIHVSTPCTSPLTHDHPGHSTTTPLHTRTSHIAVYSSLTAHVVLCVPSVTLIAEIFQAFSTILTDSLNEIHRQTTYYVASAHSNPSAFTTTITVQCIDVSPAYTHTHTVSSSAIHTITSRHLTCTHDHDTIDSSYICATLHCRYP